MNILYYFLFALIFLFCSTQKRKPQEKKNDFKQPIEYPEIIGNENIIKHFAYTLSYNERHEQANWIAYQLKSTELEKKFKRTDNFKTDPLISTGSATKKDYKGSGYDRGHLAPAADMTWNDTAMNESFYFSNMSPQLASFNRGIWKVLEEKVRDWTVLYDSIYITTGPVFRQTDSTIGENKITIPSHFYKSILIYNDSIKQSIGFILPHEKSKHNIFKYFVTIDSLEIFSGINFFSTLPDLEEESIESKIDSSYWRD